MPQGNGLNAAVVLQGFKQQIENDQCLGSLFTQMSNAFNVNALPTSADVERNRVPTDFVHTIPKAEFSEETRSLKQVMLERPQFNFVGGAQIAEGKEKGITLSKIELFHNVWRIPFRLFNGKDAESNMQRYYIKASQKSVVANQATSELRDLFYHQAMFEGACELLTDNKYWKDHENTDFQTAPLSVRMHPNWFYKGMTTAPTRSTDLATDKANLNTALANMTPSSVFDLAALKSFIKVLRRRCRPMNWKVGSTQINHVVILSEYQAEQLTTDSNWIDLMKNAEPRGPENRAISGIIGIHLNTLILVDVRAPVWSLNTSSMLYMRPDTKASDNTIRYYSGEQSIDRVVKGGAGVATGTVELAFGGGAGAIMHPEPLSFDLTSDTFDYGFREGFCASSIEGMQRPDWTRSDGTTINCPTSCVYATATPTIMA